MASMSGIYLGASGLRVNQAALNTAAHNLANVDTRGFVRQQMVLSDTRYNNVGYTHFNTLQKGLGSTVLSVRQVREVFLDRDYRKEIGRQSFYEAGHDAVEEVESLFGELEGVRFQDNIGDFWYALQEISKEPDSIAARATWVETAIALVERSERIYQQIDDYQVNLNEQVIAQVDRINDIGDYIKELNSQIKKYESNGVENANDLRDTRNSLLDELGKIVNMKYRENLDGGIDITIEGQQFLSDGTVYHMDVMKTEAGSELLKPIWPSDNNSDVFNMDIIPKSANDTDIGSLKGLIYARGNGKANYTDIPVREDFETQEAFEHTRMKYNRDIDPSVILTTLAQFDQLMHGIVTRMNDILSPNKEVTLSDGTKILIFDEDKAPMGMDEDQTRGEALFNRKSVDRYQEESTFNIIVVDENGNEVEKEITARIYNQEDPNDRYSLFTLGEIEVNPNIIANYSKIPLSSNSGSGEYDIEVAEELLKKWHEPFATTSPNSLTKNSFTDYYTSFTGDIANKGQQYRKISENQDTMVRSIDNQRTRVTGVSSDEELTSLIKFQHSYNASARYIDVVSDMLEHVIMRMA